MMQTMNVRRLLPLIILSLLAAGCRPAAVPEPTPIPTAAEPTAAPAAPTETPVPATLVWVSLGGAMPQTQMQELVMQTQSLAQQAGMQMEQIPTVSMADLDANASRLRAVVVLPNDPGVAEMASRYPQIAFISVGIPDLPELPNLYRVAAEGTRPEWDGFLAGYVAAMITPEWRIGILTQSGSAEGERAAEGFINGGVLYCGLCLTEYPPYTDYPYRLDIPAGGTAADWQPVADQFIASGVKVAYVYPGVASADLMSYLAANGLMLIGSNPPADDIQPAWVATIQTDLTAPLSAAWQDQLAGQAPGTYSTRPKIVSEYTGYLSEGKMHLLDGVIDDLVSGTIEPLTVQ